MSWNFLTTCFFPPPSAKVMNVKKALRPMGANSSWSMATRCKAGIVPLCTVTGNHTFKRLNQRYCIGVIRKPYDM